MTGLKLIIELDNVPMPELSERIGVDKSLIYRWMKGTKTIPEQRIWQLHELFPYCPVDYISKELTQLDEMDITYKHLLETIEQLKTSDNLGSNTLIKKLELQAEFSEYLIYKQKIIQRIDDLFPARKINTTKEADWFVEDIRRFLYYNIVGESNGQT